MNLNEQVASGPQIHPLINFQFETPNLHAASTSGQLVSVPEGKFDLRFLFLDFRCSSFTHVRFRLHWDIFIAELS